MQHPCSSRPRHLDCIAEVVRRYYKPWGGSWHAISAEGLRAFLFISYVPGRLRVRAAGGRQHEHVNSRACGRCVLHASWLHDYVT